MNKQQWLTEFESERKRERRSARIKESWLAWLRVIVFLGGVSLVFFFNISNVSRVLLVVGSALLFAIVVKIHRNAVSKRKLVDALLTICDETTLRLGGKINLIRSCKEPEGNNDILGSPFHDGHSWPLTDQETGDLDHFEPPVGIFGLLNRTSTTYGARRLRDVCRNPLVDVRHILTRQEVVKRLVASPGERITVMAGMLPSRVWDRENDKFAKAVRETRRSFTGGTRLLLKVWSAVGCAAFLLMLGYAGAGATVWLYPMLLLVCLNGFIYLRLRSTLEPGLLRWRNTAGALSALAIACDTAVAALDRHDEEPLMMIREILDTLSRPRVLLRLFRTLGSTESGGDFHAVFNIFMFFDFHVLDAVERRVVRHREQILHGVAAVAELDMYCSLSAFAWEQPEPVFPKFSDRPRLEITDGRHPLIEPHKAIPNSVILDDERRMWIITGSNMAGKSTLLRMVGINALLAQVGTTVAAAGMTLSPVRLITDLKAHDSLADGESYFLAEVRHVKRMVCAPEADAPILGLVDEPLRGTNSMEQTAAGIAVLEHFRNARHFVLVATHEQEMTSVADGKAIRNMHFQERLEQQGMVFDYRIYDGPARTRNAIRVLEREGFPAALVARARQWLAEEAADKGSP